MYTKYKYSVDRGLAVTVKDGKAVLVQNPLVGDPEFNIRNAALECAVMDKSGVIYRGTLKSNIVDLEYDMSEKEIKDALDSTTKSELIQPVRNKNWGQWKPSE